MQFYISLAIAPRSISQNTAALGTSCISGTGFDLWVLRGWSQRRRVRA